MNNNYTLGNKATEKYNCGYIISEVYDMQREFIYAVQSDTYGKLEFWYKCTNEMVHLFTIKYRKNVHEYFKKGRCISELYKHKSWRKSPFLCDLIEKKIKSEVRRIA